MASLHVVTLTDMALLIAPRSSPSGSSRSAGSAALARFDNQHRRDQPRTKPRIHGDASSGATAGGVSKKRAVCSQVPSVEETVPKVGGTGCGVWWSKEG